MTFTTPTSMFAERKERYEPRQENTRANDSLITTLVIATIAMVGLTLALHFGAFAVSPAGLIGWDVGTGIVGIGLIAVIALRCMGGSKPHRESSFTNDEPIRKSVSPLPSSTYRASLVHGGTVEAPTVTVVLENDREKQFYVKIGDPDQFNYAPNSCCLIVELARTDGRDPRVWYVTTSDTVKRTRHFMNLSLLEMKDVFDGRIDYKLPLLKREGQTEASVAGILQQEHKEVKKKAGVSEGDGSRVVGAAADGELYSEPPFINQEFALATVSVRRRIDGPGKSVLDRKSDGIWPGRSVVVKLHWPFPQLAQSAYKEPVGARGVVGLIFNIKLTNVDGRKVAYDAQIHHPEQSHFAAAACLRAKALEARPTAAIDEPRSEGAACEKPVNPVTARDSVAVAQVRRRIDGPGKSVLDRKSDAVFPRRRVVVDELDLPLDPLLLPDEWVYEGYTLSGKKTKRIVTIRLVNGLTKQFPVIVGSREQFACGQFTFVLNTYCLLLVTTRDDTRSAKLCYVSAEEDGIEYRNLEDLLPFEIEYLFDNRKGYKLPKLKKIDEAGASAPADKQAKTQIVVVEETPTLETAQHFLASYAPGTIAHNSAAQNISFISMATDGALRIDTYKYVQVDPFDRRQLQLGEHFVTLHRGRLYHVFRREEEVIEYAPLRQSCCLSWLQNSINRDKYIGDTQSVERLTLLDNGAASLLDAKDSIARALEIENSVVVILANRTKCVAVKDEENEGEFLCTPLLDVASDFNVALIPEGKVLFVTHQGEMKKATINGFQPLIKTTISGQMKKDDFLFWVLNLTDGISVVSDTVDVMMAKLLVGEREQGLLYSCRENEGHFMLFNPKFPGNDLFVAANYLDALKPSGGQVSLFLDENKQLMFLQRSRSVTGVWPYERLSTFVSWSPELFSQGPNPKDEWLDE